MVPLLVAVLMLFWAILAITFGWGCAGLTEREHGVTLGERRSSIGKPNSFMASECLTMFLPRERFLLRPALFPAKTLNFNYLQHAPGWFGLRSSPESSSWKQARKARRCQTALRGQWQRKGVRNLFRLSRHSAGQQRNAKKVPDTFSLSVNLLNSSP